MTAKSDFIESISPADESGRSVRAAVAQLEDKTAEVLYRRVVIGESASDVATDMQLTGRRVAAIASSGIGRLRELLRGD